MQIHSKERHFVNHQKNDIVCVPLNEFRLAFSSHKIFISVLYIEFVYTIYSIWSFEFASVASRTATGTVTGEIRQ